MKRILYLSLILSLTLFACRPAPRASFSTDNSEPEVGQNVYFDNNSRNADEYEWDFGDGFASYEANPVHVFAGSGTFTVSLTAKSHGGYTDEATMDINVMIPTILEIEVREFYSENAVPDASVFLYPTLPDWEGETNLEAEGYSDADGVVVFSGLGPFVWYVDVWEATHDNYQLKNEDVAYIRTDEIIPNKINRFTAWVDIVDHGKGAIRSSGRTLYIKDVVRKADIKSLTFTDSKDWKALYDKSVKVK
jgi:PKD repeat protein